MGIHTQEEITAMAHDLIRLSDRINELEAALKPFAREADEYKGWTVGITVEADEQGGMRDTWYTIGDLRRAKELLSEDNQQTL